MQHYSFAVKAFVELVKQFGMDEDERMTIGYIKRKGIPLSSMGKLYIAELAKYENQVL